MNTQSAVDFFIYIHIICTVFSFLHHLVRVVVSVGVAQYKQEELM